MLEDLCRHALASEGETPTLPGVIRRLRQHEGGLARLGIRQLYVYGSVARGDARPGATSTFAASRTRAAGTSSAGAICSIDWRRFWRVAVDFGPRRTLPEDVHPDGRRRRSGVRVRPEYELVTDIVRHGRLILDLIGPLDEADFVERFGEGITPFGAAISFALVALSEACRQLIGGGATGGPPQARIVTAHPEIDWRAWVGLRNVLTRGLSSP